jgi:hypothetical protein
MRSVVLIIAVAMTLPAVIVIAGERSMSRIPTITFTDGAERKPCECRAHGKVFVTGEETCLNGALAVCAMDQNVTTWRGTGRICPQS